jgi:hypothetical protein
LHPTRAPFFVQLLYHIASALADYCTVKAMLVEWLMLPEVAVTTSVVVPVGVPGFAALLLLPPPQPLSASKDAATSIRAAAPTKPSE